MAAQRLRHPERRSANRAQNGDLRPCRCGRGAAEFNERYRVNGVPMPAWVCDACGTRVLARAIDCARDVLRASKEVHAQARRTAMKARARIERSRKQLAAHRDRVAPAKRRR